MRGGPVEGADDPGELEVCGCASWQPRLGLLVVRNPADRAQSIQLTLRDAWQLPPTVHTPFTLRRINGPEPPGHPLRATPDGKVNLSLQPFQVLVLEGTPDTTAATPNSPAAPSRGG